MSLILTFRIFFELYKRLHLYNMLDVKNAFTESLLKCKYLKLTIRVFLAGCVVVTVTIYLMRLASHLK